MADARGRADAAAAGAGMRVDRVVRIEEQRADDTEPRPMMMARQSMVADGRRRPPIVTRRTRESARDRDDDVEYQIGSTASPTISASISDS